MSNHRCYNCKHGIYLCQGVSKMNICFASVGAGRMWMGGGDACVARSVSTRTNRAIATTGDASVPSPLIVRSRPYSIHPIIFFILRCTHNPHYVMINTVIHFYQERTIHHVSGLYVEGRTGQ